ncbi:hypothetical protein N658DRAFT_323455 [Parathielavia hyrcaniae]|uniref:Uncharacterized protein n=1 Tax=Parathielavia hyrcaniae TaxID=113614 RepID=A0AAN6Q3D5_9PEZI|nr:hypothetical protein N658DRAFT_323455 [Parathielavia hyrcaniae]
MLVRVPRLWGVAAPFAYRGQVRKMVCCQIKPRPASQKAASYFSSFPVGFGFCRRRRTIRRLVRIRVANTEQRNQTRPEDRGTKGDFFAWFCLVPEAGEMEGDPSRWSARDSDTLEECYGDGSASSLAPGLISGHRLPFRLTAQDILGGPGLLCRCGEARCNLRGSTGFM